MQEVQVERKYQTAIAAVAGFKKLAPAKEFADIYISKDLNDLQSMGVAPFTVQEIAESTDIDTYVLCDATGEIWMRAEIHLNQTEEM